MPLPQKDFDKLVSGIMQFIVEFGGLPFYSYQYVFARRIVVSVLRSEGATITGLWSRQTGKTTTVAITGVGLAVILPVLANRFDGGENEDGTKRPYIEELQPYKEGFWVGIFAPIARQASLSYSRMRKILHSTRGQLLLEDDQIDVHVQSSRGDSLELSHGSYVHAKTASPDSNIEGETYHLVITDESQKLDRFKMEKEIEPMLSSTNGTLVKIGTAWMTRGGFHSDIQWNIETFRKKVSDRNHFEFPYDVVIQEKEEAYKRDGNKFHLNYKKYVEKYIRKRGVNSLAFRMNFMLKWQESNLDVFSAAALLDIQDTSRHLNSYVATSLTRVAGIDVGKDNDPTVITINEVDFESPIKLRDPLTGEEEEYHRKKFVAFLELEGTFEDRGGEQGQYSRAVEFLRQWDVTKATIDATSMGDPVAERMQKLSPEIEWEFFKYSSPTKHNLFKVYIDEIESGRQQIAASAASKQLSEFKKWLEEHRNLEKHYTDNNRYMVCRAPEPESKAAKDVEMEGEYHDDYPNSCALACWAAKSATNSEVEVVAAGSGGVYSGGRPSTQQRYGRRR
jgi:hypothetical protein